MPSGDGIEEAVEQGSTVQVEGSSRMRFRVSGVDARTGDDVEVEIEADSQKEAFEIAKQRHRLFPKSAATLGGSRWVYKMVQIPPMIEITGGAAQGTVAAAFLEAVVNDDAETGWEFLRIDEIGVRVIPGCLGWLFGAPVYHLLYYVVTFRQWVDV